VKHVYVAAALSLCLAGVALAGPVGPHPGVPHAGGPGPGPGLIYPCPDNVTVSVSGYPATIWRDNGPMVMGLVSADISVSSSMDLLRCIYQHDFKVAMRATHGACQVTAGKNGFVCASGTQVKP
jgi:hypothetical protein